MQFEPRIVNDRVAEVEEPLPCDLALLGQQLTDDARWLARQYEADGSREPLSPSVPRGRGPRRLKWAAAAMLLMATGLATSSGLLVWNGPDSDGSNHRIAGMTKEDVDGGLPERTTLRSLSPRVPVVGFEDLSGPQQEAVLDLWESLAHGSSSLSI